MIKTKILAMTLIFEISMPQPQAATNEAIYVANLITKYTQKCRIRVENNFQFKHSLLCESLVDSIQVLGQCRFFENSKWDGISWGDCKTTLPLPQTPPIPPVPPPTPASHKHVPIILEYNQALISIGIGSLGALAVIDTGASEMSVTQPIADKLIINNEAIEGPALSITQADGKSGQTRSIIIGTITIGEYVLHNVRSVVEPNGSECLIGYGVLNKISNKFAIDTDTSTLDFE
jgi:hypothetical protein